jgi:hypothetical protein
VGASSGAALPPVHADPDLLSHVLLDLLANVADGVVRRAGSPARCARTHRTASPRADLRPPAAMRS